MLTECRTATNSEGLPKLVASIKPEDPPATVRNRSRSKIETAAKLNIEKQTAHEQYKPGGQDVLKPRLNRDFSNKYKVVSELGSGGFGFVVSAVPRNGKEPAEVAVKFINKRKVPARNWAKDKDLGIVPMEVYLLKNLHQDQIVKYVDFFQDELFAYLVMEFHGRKLPTLQAAKKNTTRGLIPTMYPKRSTDRDSKKIIIQENFSQSKEKEGKIASTGSTTTNPEWGANITLNPDCQTKQPKETTCTNKSITYPLFGMLEQRPSTDLFECIEKNKRLTEDEAKKVFKQIVDCVYYLHSKGVIHRDIKDENVVVDDDLQVKLIDFGSAAIEPLNNPNYLFDRFQGTIQYASPEILRGEKYKGKPVDIWALGTLLYTLLFGQVPFSSSKQVLNAPFRKPRYAVSKECMDLLCKLLTKNVRERPLIKEVKNHTWLRN